MSSSATNDFIQSFHMESANSRGVIVRLEQSWQQVRAHGAHGEGVESVLGQCLIAAALFAGDVKLAASLSVQLRSSTALRTVHAECSETGRVRGIARLGGEGEVPRRVSEFGTDALLAITMEWRERNVRRQGLVPLEGETLAQAFEAYFAQSEQLPTRMHLIATPDRCVGMLVQQVAEVGGVQRGTAGADFERVTALFDTLKDSELLELPPETVLHRLFHEETVRLHPRQALSFGCRCSRERVAQVLLALGRVEIEQTLAERGEVEVHCEFCDQRYVFDAVDVGQIFAEQPGHAAPESRQ